MLQGSVAPRERGTLMSKNKKPSARTPGSPIVAPTPTSAPSSGTPAHTAARVNRLMLVQSLVAITTGIVGATMGVLAYRASREAERAQETQRSVQDCREAERQLDRA